MRIPRRISEWAYTFVGGCIGGGAGAVCAALGLTTAKAVGVTDLPTVNFHVFGVIFLSGVVSHAMMFLAKSPLPPMGTGNTDFITKPETAETATKP